MKREERWKPSTAEADGLAQFARQRSGEKSAIFALRAPGH